MKKKIKQQQQQQKHPANVSDDFFYHARPENFMQIRFNTYFVMLPRDGFPPK